ncbi:MAG: HipA domain-containing protein [Methylacidiphilales bacterium]|nr:HipA domain-containing protein [Candidatus Methylacidiphilales bacterium]
MKRCPITYEPVSSWVDYSAGGLKLLDRNLLSLAPLAYTAVEQRQEALERAGKMSIPGVQLKLSAVLKSREGRFEVVDCNGKFILKPPGLDFPELPENEDLTMRLAAGVGIETPLHGLVYASDGSFTYFIRRFDREARKGRIPLEDFSQLSGASRETKYESSMEEVAAIVERFCTFPAIERVKLFERTLFSFLTGNEDMHLKNFSLITRRGRIDLAPAYDLVNSTIALTKPKEEMALPLHGKRSSLTRSDLFSYFAGERLQINDRILGEIIQRFQAAFPLWDELIAGSFLSPNKKISYAGVLKERKSRLGFAAGE